MAKVLIVSDSPTAKDKLKKYLSSQKTMNVLGSLPDFKSAIDTVAKLMPDVILTDMRATPNDIIAFVSAVHSINKTISCIVITEVQSSKFMGMDSSYFEIIQRPKSFVALGDVEFLGEIAKKINEVISSRLSRYKSSLPTSVLKRSSIDTALVNSDIYSTMSEKIVIAIGASTGGTEATVEVLKNLPSSTPGIVLVQHLVNSDIYSTMSEKIVIAIGASTGGTEATVEVLKNLPSSTPGIVLVQHMPKDFTRMYAERLNKVCRMSAKEAEDGDRVRRGLIILAQGESHLRLKRDTFGYFISSKSGGRVSGHCPSVDVLFESVADTAGSNAVGVILTGMGSDGAKGMLKMRNSGAYTIGQDKATSVVYGMPMVAYNNGAVKVQLPLGKISSEILKAVLEINNMIKKSKSVK